MSKITVNRKDYVVGKRSIRYKGKPTKRKPWPKGSPLSGSAKHKLEGNEQKKP